jgi:hypothetical protein
MVGAPAGLGSWALAMLVRLWFFSLCNEVFFTCAPKEKNANFQNNRSEILK